MKSTLRIACAVGAIVAVAWVVVAQPTVRRSAPSARSVDEGRMREVVSSLSERFHPRSHTHVANLDAAAAYIADHFRNAGGAVEVQEFSVWRQTYKNVRCVLGGSAAGAAKRRRVVVGAHYDTHEDTPGADDNASGVAGLVELAYLLGEQGPELDYEVELVAYSLEEPPFYGSEQMGSFFHAELLVEEGHDVAGAIVLEMIGYFSDTPGSQNYPMPLLRLFYPGKGNFVLVVGRLEDRKQTRLVKRGMKGVTDLPVYSINAPVAVPGIDFSDHRNYWEFGMEAVMVTDTAFYRNDAYHEANDTIDRLDFDRMGKAVLAVLNAIELVARR